MKTQPRLTTTNLQPRCHFNVGDPVRALNDNRVRKVIQLLPDNRVETLCYIYKLPAQICYAENELELIEGRKAA